MPHRIDPLKQSDTQEIAEGFKNIEAILGFVPNSSLIMARHPDLLRAFQQMAVAALAPHRLDRALKMMLGHMASRAAGCGYCIAHTGHVLEALGLSEEKFEALWTFETSSHFSAAEKAALRLALGAGQVPNSVSDEDFAELKKHFDQDQIVEMVGVIALYGFLNRWNDTLATELERSPLQFLRTHLPEEEKKHQKHIQAADGSPPHGRPCDE